jgi:hypothetical protein
MQQKNAQGLRPLEKKSLALESESVFYRYQTEWGQCYEGRPEPRLHRQKHQQAEPIRL